MGSSRGCGNVDMRVSTLELTQGLQGVKSDVNDVAAGAGERRRRSSGVGRDGERVAMDGRPGWGCVGPHKQSESSAQTTSNSEGLLKLSAAAPSYTRAPAALLCSIVVWTAVCPPSRPPASIARPRTEQKPLLLRRTTTDDRRRFHPASAAQRQRPR